MKNTLYVMQGDNLFKWSAVQSLCSTAPVLPLVFATLGDETAHSLQIERPAISRADVVVLDGKGNAVRRETSYRVLLCREEGPSLVYRGEESPVPKVINVGPKNRKLWPSMITESKTKR